MPVDGLSSGVRREEGLAFENLVLVTRNYAAHGFRRVLLTDLQPRFVAQVHVAFAGLDHRTFTLRQPDQERLRAQVLQETRSSGYRDAPSALQANLLLYERGALPGERFVDVGRGSVEDVARSIATELGMRTDSRGS